MRVSLPDIDYKRPETLDDLLKLITGNNSSYSVLAGGTDLIIDIRYKIKTPELAIDLKGIDELRKIVHEEGKGLHIEATATINDVLQEKTMVEKYSCLNDACSDYPAVQSNNGGKHLHCITGRGFSTITASP
ncbi:MAG: FAD binding domain-containing protein [Candidatus Hodarchaeales archaeon]